MFGHMHWLEKKWCFCCSQFIQMDDYVGIVICCKNHLGRSNFRMTIQTKKNCQFLLLTISGLIKLHLVLQHFQLALIDSTPCTLSKAESKYPPMVVHFNHHISFYQETAFSHIMHVFFFLAVNSDVCYLLERGFYRKKEYFLNQIFPLNISILPETAVARETA